MNEPKIKSLSIHGSCVSRDIFNFMEKEEILIKTYIARSCIISSVSAPLDKEIKEEDIDLSSQFQRKLLLIDMNKLVFKKLKENKSDYLIIDLIDERFNLFKVKNSYITYSNEFLKSKLEEKMNGQIILKKDIDMKMSYYAIDNYIKKIKEIYEEENIIINEVYFSDKIKDDNGNVEFFPEYKIESNKFYNNMLKMYYSYLKDKLPNSHVIDISQKYLAYEKHIWGIEPFHYEDGYYKESLEIIKKVI